MLKIRTLKQLRDMDISKGCPKVEGLPDTIDPTKYYPYICEVLSQKWVHVETVIEYINDLRKSKDMWRYSEDDVWSKFEEILTNQKKDLSEENNISSTEDNKN